MIVAVVGFLLVTGLLRPYMSVPTTSSLKEVNVILSSNGEDLNIKTKTNSFAVCKKFWIDHDEIQRSIDNLSEVSVQVAMINDTAKAMISDEPLDTCVALYGLTFKGHTVFGLNEVRNKHQITVWFFIFCGMFFLAWAFFQIRKILRAPIDTNP